MEAKQEKMQKDSAARKEAEELNVNELLEIQGGEDADDDFECNGSGSGVHCYVANSGAN